MQVSADNTGRYQFSPWHSFDIYLLRIVLQIWMREQNVYITRSLDDTSWYLNCMVKNRNLVCVSVLLCFFFVCTYLSHLNPQNNVIWNYIANWKALFQLLSVPSNCSVIIITLQIKRDSKHTEFFYHSDKTDAQLLEPRFRQWIVLAKGAIISLYRRGSHT